MQYFNLFTEILFIMALGWYLITNLQWYNYKLERVILKHHKQVWHFTYFIFPIIIFYILNDILFIIFFYIVYLSLFYLWNKKLDKPLVFTSRVKRFLAILLFLTFSIYILCLTTQFCNFSNIIWVPLLLAYLISTLFEKFLFYFFKRQAKKRLESIKNLQIVAITASYGKTSIKNYLYQVIKNKFITYKTPRSVNTIAGIVLDVNEYLPLDTQVYIAEAAARQEGDILEITTFLEPQYCLIGSVGEQHIEYFKKLDNIIRTKMEILQSPRIKKGFVHESVPLKSHEMITKFPDNLRIKKSNLDGIWFDVNINGQKEHFYSPLIGSFNAINLTAVILLATQLGMSLDDIKTAFKTLKPVPHRLQLIKANNKIIVDDSFNGNLEGMLEAINICSTYNEGRKIIVTPGLVESTKEANTTLAQEINKSFDLAIITGQLNSHLLSTIIDKEKIVVLKDKSILEDTLSQKTQSKDLILFANDAPNFI